MNHDCCGDCEQLLQLYLDCELTDQQTRETEQHLDACGYCRGHYRFERLLRARLREATAEPISAELVARLDALRSGTS